MTRRSRKTIRWMSNVLLLAGVLAVAVSVGSFVSMKLWERSQNRAFDEQRAATQRQSESSGQVEAPQGEITHFSDGAIVGRLTIPRLHVRAMIREGTSSPVLSVALGHIPGTALPGQPGNIGVAGHRDTLFRALRNVARNDEITFETPGATYSYRVISMQIVNPRDVAVLNPGPTSEITLVTCYPFDYIGAAPERFIVKASLTSQNLDHNDIPQAPLRTVSAPIPRTTPAAPAKSGTVDFSVPQGHSRELIPGKIWFGVDSTDPESQTVNGWLWVMPDRRTTWLRHTDAHDPVVFYQDGAKRELFITSIGRNSAQGYIVALPERG